MRRRRTLRTDYPELRSRFLAFLLLLAGTLFGVSPAAAAPTATAAPSNVRPATEPAARFTRGLLWKIEAAGKPASYLFGTIHSDDPRVLDLPGSVTRALDGSQRFVMEAVIDGGAIVHMAETMFFKDGRTLEQVIGKKLYAETMKALAARGIPAAGVEKQKPWAVMMALSMPKPRTGEYLDLVLQAHAARAHIPVSGLETIAEQLAVFDELSPDIQTSMLEEAVRLQPELTKRFEELHRAWLKQDLAALMEFSEKYKPADEKAYRHVMDRLLTQRNRRMAERLAPLLQSGGVFIAVGAAHLPGTSGLLYEIEKAGYRLTRVD